MPGPLTTASVESSDFAQAANELMKNAKLLIVSGRFEEAHFALDLLLQPGPWKAGNRGRIVQELEQLVPVVCRLSDKPSPEVGATQAMPPRELADWAAEQVKEILDVLAMPIRQQLTRAGENWSEAYLRGLLEITDAALREKTFGQFCLDAEFILKDRLANLRSKPFSGLSLLTRLLHGVARIEISDTARAIPVGVIARTAARYMGKFDVAPNYMLDFIFHAVTVISLHDGQREDAVFAACALAESDMGLSTLVQSSIWPPLTELLRSGGCAAMTGIDAHAAARYLEALPHRRTRTVPARAVEISPATDSPASFRTALSGTPFAGRALFELPILDTSESAFAIPVDTEEMLDTWKAARALVGNTQRWPVLAVYGGDSSMSIEERLHDADFFSRFYFEEAPDADDVSPRAIIAAAESADLAAFLQRRKEEHDSGYTFDEALDNELECSARICGTAPERDEVTRGHLDGAPLTTHYQLERWLLDWECTHGSPWNPNDVRQPWFEDDHVVLLFLPTPHPWDALAYINWYGSSWYGVEHYIALGRDWHKRFGAELVAHFGTMLQCFVERPPSTIEEAWQLAVEQDIAAPGMLAMPGISLRHHAMGLLDNDRWFLHERP